MAKVSLGSSSTGNRLIVASAAPVTMFVGAGPDGGGAGEGGEPVAHPGEGGRRVHHALLVAGQVVGQHVRVLGLELEECLPDPGHVAVPEDPEAAFDQTLLDAVALGPLLGEETHGRLRDGETDGAHGRPSRELGRAPVSGSRGSVACPAQVSRTHPCAGSSQISQERSCDGPAITLR